ncbi:MAG TPA: hypothetical protein VJ476_08105 [Rhizomicrobium sp.]|nr:hypothetical protein [Rhizomicrobium sp.]
MRIRIAALALMIASFASSAVAAPDWNGTWAGNWQGGDGVQIIMAGNNATGMFWHGDYLPDDLHAAVSKDGKTLTITWDHASAVLTRLSDETAHLVIAEPGRAAATFDVKRDH